MLESYESLLLVLREYTSWPPSSSGPPYDVGGVAQLLDACAENLRRNALEADLELVSSALSDENRRFLGKVAGAPPRAD